eukprot:gene8087-9607_t
MPPPSRPSWAQEIDSWLAAVDTLVEAEEAPEAAEVAVEDAVQQATLAFKSRLPPQTQVQSHLLTRCLSGHPPRGSERHAAAGKWVRKGSSLPADHQYWRVRKDLFEKYEKQL